MDFESPDVEKDFPGLYASQSVKKNDDSDFSDESHEKVSKKDLLIGKKKDKKDSKKDRGYAALEGESSPEEDLDIKSPSKSKKSKSFKFTSKKLEKREKSRDKDVKEKETEKDKKKEKKDKDKDKSKSKDKKKSKHSGDNLDIAEDHPIFGVPLEVAVEWCGCHDGVKIPLVLRDCIDFIHSCGLTMESLYKISGIKSRIHSLRKLYNQREIVLPSHYDVPTATSLLKIFLRELPEPILTNDLLTRFEEAGAIKEVGAREMELENLLSQLPVCNRATLGWLIVHFDVVTSYEKQNKINAQSIAMTFSCVLQMSHRLLTAFLCHCKALFPNIVITKYIPPLSSGSVFPESSTELMLELKKQESLLNQIHKEMNAGYVTTKREEQLWEVQRIITQLKRKLKSFHRLQPDAGPGNEQQQQPQDDEVKNQAVAVVDDEQQQQHKLTEECKKSSTSPATSVDQECSETSSTDNTTANDKINTTNGVSPDVVTVTTTATDRHVVMTSDDDEDSEQLLLQIENQHLLKLQTQLQNRIDYERACVDKLKNEILMFGDLELFDVREEDYNKEELSEEVQQRLEQLMKENSALEQKKNDLIRLIIEEQEACVKLRVQISYFDILHGASQLV